MNQSNIAKLLATHPNVFALRTLNHVGFSFAIARNQQRTPQE